jgi:hypothetical protein
LEVRLIEGSCGAGWPRQAAEEVQRRLLVVRRISSLAHQSTHTQFVVGILLLPFLALYDQCLNRDGGRDEANRSG